MISATEKANTVLLIDDDASTVMVTTALLEQEGYVTSDVGSIAAARTHLTSYVGKYDVVLLDLHLPDGLSLPLVPIVRATQPDAKLVLVSGDIMKSTEYSVDGYFAKGGEFPALLTQLERLLGRK